MLQLLHHAITAEPTAAAALAGHDAIGDQAERVVRWLGSLPDQVSGVDVDATALALRSVLVLEPESAETLVMQMLDAGVDDTYRAVVELAGGASGGGEAVAVIAGLPPTIALPVAARFGSCDDVNSVLRGDRQTTATTGDATLDGVLAAIARRCDLPPASAVARSALDEVVFRAAEECATADRPSDAVSSMASDLEDATSWMWDTVEMPTIQAISTRVAVLMLARGSCSGFWWTPR
jgi:hypothetical protein